MVHLRILALIATLIAAVPLVGTVTPSAFAQTTSDVDATQDNPFTADSSQSASPSASASGDGSVNQEISQGFCLQVNQQNAAAGNDATNSAANVLDSAANVVDSAADVVDSAANMLEPGTASGDFSEDTGIDCS
jgi:hypothetical protein